MAFSRRLGVISIVGVSWLVAIGCDDDEDKISQAAGAGEAGEAPGGGKASVAGTKNTGGKAGSSPGNGGEGGTMTAGAGAGGDAGNGATAASAGQAGSGGASGAGGGGIGGATGGQGGAGGEGGALTVVAPHCSFTCASDDDCLVDGDDSIKCNLTTHSCEDPTEACTVDADCLAGKSGWFKPCTDDSSCTANTEACVDASGQGFCAPLPGDGAPACDEPNVTKTLPRFGAQGTVPVCAYPDARCFNRKCLPGCGAPNRGCVGNGDTCSAVTGLCECSDGAQCTATTGICGQDGHCQECVNDDDCAENAPDTACVEGKCGCATSTVCMAIDPGYASAAAACQ